MKLGAEPKKVAVLIGLLCVASYFLFFGGEDAGPSRAARTASPANQPDPEPRNPGAYAPARRDSERSTRRSRYQRGGLEFRPSIGSRQDDAPLDPMEIDPTLRLDLLAKLQEVEVGDVDRSLFEFGRPPAPPKPEPKVEAKVLEEMRKKQREAAAEATKRTPRKPPPPPIPLKFYGFIDPQRAELDKRAFFLDGEEIFIAAEGELVKKGRYKIVQINVNSAVVEDTEHNHKQTLKLEEVRG